MTEDEALEKSELLHLAEIESTIQQLRDKPPLKPTGFCLYCGVDILPTAINQRFCDVDCRDDYDLYGSQL